MSSTSIPPRDADEEWLDEAILVAILGIQFGNAAGRRATKVMSDSVRSEVLEAIRAMGRNPSAARVRATLARIDRAFNRSINAVRRSIFRDSRTLIGVERSNLPDGIDKPTTASMVAALGSRLIVGRTLDDYLETWIRQGALGRVRAIVRQLSASGSSPAAIAARVSVDMVKTTLAVGSITKTVMADTSVMVRSTAANGRRLVWISVLDDRTTVQCINLDGDTWIEGEPHVIPPIHINCRSTIGIFMGSGTGANMPKYVEWLRRQGSAVQNTVLGVERAIAWRAGSLSISQMVDATRTRTLTLDALRKLGRL